MIKFHFKGYSAQTICDEIKINFPKSNNDNITITTEDNFHFIIDFLGTATLQMQDLNNAACLNFLNLAVYAQ